MKEKYVLTDETKEVNGRTLHRIKAVRSFGIINKGDLGGWVERYDNLSDAGDCWVSGNAMVYGDARVDGYAMVAGYAEISRIDDYIVFKNFWSSGRHFTWTRSNNMWHVGCFYGTGEELITKAYADSDLSGREYERVVRYVESILKDNKKGERDCL